MLVVIVLRNVIIKGLPATFHKVTSLALRVESLDRFLHSGLSGDDYNLFDLLVRRSNSRLFTVALSLCRCNAAVFRRGLTLRKRWFLAAHGWINPDVAYDSVPVATEAGRD